MDEPVPVFAGDAPAPLGAYPHAVRAAGLVFCSGQGARDPETGEVAGLARAADGTIVGHDAAVQTAACFRNLRRVLEAAGSGLDRLVEVQVFLRDIDDFAAMNEVYARHVTGGGPARTTVGVADLPGDNFVEIRAVALAGPAPGE